MYTYLLFFIISISHARPAQKEFLQRQHGVIGVHLTRLELMLHNKQTPKHPAKNMHWLYLYRTQTNTKTCHNHIHQPWLYSLTNTHQNMTWPHTSTLLMLNNKHRAKHHITAHINLIQSNTKDSVGQEVKLQWNDGDVNHGGVYVQQVSVWPEISQGEKLYFFKLHFFELHFFGGGIY